MICTVPLGCLSVFLVAAALAGFFFREVFGPGEHPSGNKPYSWPPPPHGGDWSTRPDEIKRYGYVPPKPDNFQAPPPVIPTNHPSKCPCCHNGISGY